MKTEEEMKEKALGLLKCFIKEKLKDDIDNLKKYSFWGILEDKGSNKDFNGVSSNEKDFDGDRTKIVYAIDYLLYDNLPEFKIPGYTLEAENYTGETINTFNTLFSGAPEKREKIKALFGEDWKKIQDEDKGTDFFADDFYHVYQRLGNFMLLPSKTISDGQSINKYKGNCKGNIKDYFDLFFRELKELLPLNGEKNNSSTLLRLLETNNFYFKDKKADDFLEDFYLDGYKDFNLGEEYFSSRDSLKEQYKKFALDYVEKATEFINLRSEKLVDKLKEKYPELKK